MPQAVYVACADPRLIEVYTLDVASGLVLRGVIEVPGLEQPSPISMPLAVSPNADRLYVALRQPPFPLCSFACGERYGLPRLLGETTVPGSVAYMAVAQGGSHLLCACGPEGQVISLRIDDDGVARSVAHLASVPRRGHCVVPSRAGPYAYATSVGADLIIRYHYDAETGRLDDPRQTAMPAGSGPRHLVCSEDGRTVYCINERDATIGVLRVELDTGDLELQEIVPTLASGTDALAADIHLTPDGQLLYVSERNTNVISGWRVGGAEEPLAAVSVTATEDWTRSFAVDSTGSFLLAAGQRSNHLSLFAIDLDTGRLTLVSRHATGGNPSWVEILPMGAHRHFRPTAIAVAC